MYIYIYTYIHINLHCNLQTKSTLPVFWGTFNPERLQSFANALDSRFKIWNLEPWIEDLYSRLSQRVLEILNLESRVLANVCKCFGSCILTSCNALFKGCNVGKQWPIPKSARTRKTKGFFEKMDVLKKKWLARRISARKANAFSKNGCISSKEVASKEESST